MPVFPSGLGLALLLIVPSFAAMVVTKANSAPRPLWATLVSWFAVFSGVRMLVGLLEDEYFGSNYYWIAGMPIAFGIMTLVDERGLAFLNRVLSLMARNKLMTSCAVLLITGLLSLELLMNVYGGAPRLVNLVPVTAIAIGVGGLILFRPRNPPPDKPERESEARDLVNVPPWPSRGASPVDNPPPAFESRSQSGSKH